MPPSQTWHSNKKKGLEAGPPRHRHGFYMPAICYFKIPINFCYKFKLLNYEVAFTWHIVVGYCQSIGVVILVTNNQNGLFLETLPTRASHAALQVFLLVFNFRLKDQSPKTLGVDSSWNHALVFDNGLMVAVRFKKPFASVDVNCAILCSHFACPGWAAKSVQFRGFTLPFKWISHYILSNNKNTQRCNLKSKLFGTYRQTLQWEFIIKLRDAMLKDHSLRIA